jgi:prenyltransferase beta subunit
MITYIRKRKYYIFIFIVLNLIISSYKEISRAITINDRATRVNCNLDKINENLANANEYLSEFELKKLKLRKVKKDFFINLEEDEAITLIEEFFNINNLNLFDIYLRKDENISSTYNCWYISGEFCGTFEEIMNLLSTLRNYEKNIIINKIDLEKLEKDLIQGSINLCLGNIKEEKGITIIPQITYLPI